MIARNGNADRIPRASVACGALFAILLTGLHVLEPEFDPTWRFVSEYMLGTFGWMMSAAFVAIASNLALTGIVVVREARTVPIVLGLIVLYIAVVGLLIAAIFPTDSITTATGSMSFSGRMHVLGASLDYTPVAALLITIGLTRRPGWREMRGVLMATAIVTILLTVAFIVSMPPDYKFGPGTYTGLIGRLLLLSYLGWTIPLSFHAVSLRRIAALRRS